MVRNVRDLYEAAKRQVVSITHSQFSMAAVDALSYQPILSGSHFAKRAAFNNRVTANGMLWQLETAGIIKRIRDGSGSKPAVYAMPQLIDIAEGRAVI